jgi:ABC-type transporter lipoprotein component MlaA/pimeloyl-ACP methyl ester carboxylesterase
VKIKKVILGALLVATISSALRAAPSPNDAATNQIILPEPIPDPLERINRGLWALNQAAMKGVVKPSGKIYRILVPPPFRIGLSNVGKNLAYPRRVVNNLLQERWTGARDESYRFLCNSVLGMGGFLDVASELRIPLSEADFGQTFGRWGWEQNFYLMAPLAGPSSDRDAAGAVADWASNPLTYFSPYNYIPTGIIYNNLTDAVDGYVRRADSEMDPYSLLRYTSALIRKEKAVDWKFDGQQHGPTLQTMQFVLFGVHDPLFPERGQTQKIRIASTGRELPYSTWLQPRPAPIVYIIPGIGAHRLNGGALALAEMLFDKGYSAVTICNPFNFEFIERGLSADLPGYAPSDVQDLHKALTLIDRAIAAQHPGRVTSRALMGYSLGGFETLMLAARAGENPGFVQFDRYLSIDAPVRLMHGIAQLDSFYDAALEWPSEERTAKIENLLLKVASLARGDVTGQTTIPLSSTESRFLIGLAFRLNLRDTIFSTQLRNNQGVLKEPLDKWKREPIYREIMNYSFTEYLDLFLAPYYKKRGIDLADQETLERAVDLRRYEPAFRNAAVHAIANENDILLGPEDVQWLARTFGERVTLFSNGGHLGNLAETAVQAAMLKALEGMNEAAARRDVISAAPKRAVSPRAYAARGTRAGF